MDIPTLKLAFPTSQREIIDLIDKTNGFLKNLDSVEEVGVDLKPKKEKYPFSDVKKILNNTSF